MELFRDLAHNTGKVAPTVLLHLLLLQPSLTGPRQKQIKILPLAIYKFGTELNTQPSQILEVAPYYAISRHLFSESEAPSQSKTESLIH